MTPHLVVVGASLAGLRSVESARRAGYDGQITLVGAETCLPYDRPPLSKEFLEIDQYEAPFFRSEQYLVDEMNVDLVLDSVATGLDTVNRIVEVGGQEIPYSGLVIATGATARTIPEADQFSGIHTLRTLEDARAIRTALDSPGRTVVIGAGFIGSEVAAAARARGHLVTIVEALHTPLVRAIGEEMGVACSALHAANGTDLRCGVTVDEFGGDKHIRWVRLSDGTVLDADLVVVGIGAQPATQWLEGSGLSLDNGVVCDERLSAGAPGVYAAGDVARWFNPRFERHMRLEHWTSAAEQGAAAGRAAALGEAAPYSTVPYFWSDWYGTRIQFAGVPDADHVETVIGHVDEGSFVALYRSHDRLTGVLALNSQAEIMKFRALIARRTSWADALDFAAQRRNRNHKGNNELHA